MAWHPAFVLASVFLALHLVKGSSKLPFHLEVEKKQRLVLSWDYDDQNTEVEVRAKVNPKSWIAFGFSDYGKYGDADFCVFWTDLWGRQHFTDVYSDGSERLHVDQHQDCQLVAVNQTAAGTVIRFTRERATCDEEDYQLEVTTAATKFPAICAS